MNVTMTETLPLRRVTTETAPVLGLVSKRGGAHCRETPITFAVLPFQIPC